MTVSRSINRRRRRRNRRQPSNPRNRRTPIVFVAKVKYENSTVTDDGVFMLSTRKRPKPTAAELEQRKQHKFEVKCKQVSLSSLRHKVMALYDHGCFMENWQFPPKSSGRIISYLQATYQQYSVYNAATVNLFFTGH